MKTVTMAFTIALVISSLDAHAETARPAVRISGSQIILIRPMQFHVGEATISTEGESVLNELRHLLVSTPSIGRIRVEYHTDCAGNASDEERLARQRTNRIREWLIAHGVSPSRVETQVVPQEQSASINLRACSTSTRNHVQIWIVG